ncbi:type III polyketide synthase [Cyanobium sp. Morenito 9A2]|uniref:type III polyketide synthase n=1 Tax=Cyanobium sp. Morenito 9A2 TaxID=2823718 RepID=UPI0020CFB9D7|nr:type III polyketide synthase [Cyanobium sp. Morenito 9A2]MCP9850533.1 type III polyketide synthase [Cyanobium sp. Morenito 9A2]
MALTLRGLGTALPLHRLNQDEACLVARAVATPEGSSSPGQQRLLETIHRRSGVATRHSVLLEPGEHGGANRQSFFGPSNPSTGARMRRYGSECGALALEAARRCLEQAELPGARITHLITVSCTGFQAPGFDFGLMRDLPLGGEVARTHVGFMGCHGTLNALRVAAGFIGADPQACVLICSVELCSLHLQYGWHPERIVANALFADGAAALVATGWTEAPAPFQQHIASGSLLIPDSQEAMSWSIEDHGFAMTLSAKVPALIAAHLRPWLQDWLARQGQSLETIGSWAVHPGGPRILSAVMEALDLAPELIEPSRAVLKSCGNMSSATILFILERLRQAQAPGPCLAMAFGPGLSVEVALLS